MGRKYLIMKFRIAQNKKEQQKKFQFLVVTTRAHKFHLFPTYIVSVKSLFK